MFSVLDDDLTTVTDATSSKEAWETLKDLHDRGTVSTTIKLLKNATERKLVNGASLQAHLTEFHNGWIRLKDRPLEGNTKMAKTLEAFTACNETKAAQLHISLPLSMDNIVDSLQTKETAVYEVVRAKLLDLSANRSVTHSSLNTPLRPSQALV